MVNPGYVAAAALVCIQVGMGILFKSVQKHGQYAVSVNMPCTKLTTLKVLVLDLVLNRNL